MGNALVELSKILIETPKVSISNYLNADCVKCGGVYKNMIRVGAFVMCSTCFKEEFGTTDPVRQERDNYLKWLDVWEKKEKS